MAFNVTVLMVTTRLAAVVTVIERL